jgi:hypothetical protein
MLALLADTAGTSEAGWITAAIGVPGAVIVLICLASALARVAVAGAFPGGEKRLVEQRLAFFTYPLAVVSAVVIITRFVQLAQ